MPSFTQCYYGQELYKGAKQMKIDIHVHSKYSERPSQWILKKIGCPESFTEPLQIYRIAKERGMTHVRGCKPKTPKIPKPIIKF
jgi:hypothetical protein